MCSTKRVPKVILKNFTNCYSGEKNKIRTLIDIDGYYEIVEVGNWSYGYGKNKQAVDTQKLNILFYDDGTFKYNFFKEKDSSICSYFTRIAMGKDSLQFYNSGYWGIYKIKGDTLICQYINKAEYWKHYYGYEIKFKITDKNVFEIIDESYKSLDNKSAILNNSKSIFLAAKFIPCEFIPPPNSWLKKLDWTWCK